MPGRQVLRTMVDSSCNSVRKLCTGEPSASVRRAIFCNAASERSATVFDNLQDISVDELIDEFGVTSEQVNAVLIFVALSAAQPVLNANTLR